MPAPTPQQHNAAPAYTPTHPTHYSQSPVPPLQQGPQAPSYQPITPHVPFTPQPTAPMQSFQTPRPVPGYPPQYAQQPSAAYKAPQPVEVYVLNDHANASIPQDIREQFQRDEKGRVLFFTAPPLNVDQPLTKEGRALGHSARYLAARAKKEQAKAEKRKLDSASAPEREAAAKRARADKEAAFKTAVSELSAKTIKALEDQLTITTKMEFELAFNGQTKQGVSMAVDWLAKAQEQVLARNVEREVHLRQREESKKVIITGMTAMLEKEI